MQCPSCHFENMPTIVNCGRCGANLQLATMDIDVNPPRATERSQSFRRLMPQFTRTWYTVSDSVRHFCRSVFGEWQVESIEPGPLLVRSIIPGWPQLYSGQIFRGRLFLGGYLALLCAGLVMFGTSWGNLLLGLAVGCHISSILDVVLNGERELGPRIRRIVVTMCGVMLLIYIPGYMFIQRVAAPYYISALMAPFEAGDVLLVDRYFTPDPGDVVLYNIPEVQFPLRPGMVMRLQGPRVDRILAGPNQHVSYENEVLKVDGQVCAWRPLNRWKPIGDFKVTLGYNQFLILPSTEINIPHTELLKTAIVGRGRIEGHVYFRNQPFSRFGFVD